MFGLKEQNFAHYDNNDVDPQTQIYETSSDYDSSFFWPFNLSLPLVEDHFLFNNMNII